MFIENTINFLLLSGGMVALLLLYAFYKAGWNKDVFKKNWLESEGKRPPVWKAILIILSIPIIIYFFLYSVNAKAEWFDGGTVFTGIDYTAEQSPLCKLGNVDDRLTSNIGFTQNIYRTKDVSFNFKYTHHSCALNADSNHYDAGGVFVEVRVW
jgi:hypothetical protein